MTMSEPTPTFDKDIQKLLADPQYQGHPLQAALSQLWDRYYSLAQRIDRVTRISDAYQSLALEREMNLDEQLEKQLRQFQNCLLYTSPSPRDKRQSRMPSSA